MSTRYLPWASALLALALVPTVIHTYIGASTDDGRTTAAIPLRLGGFDALPAERSVAWARRELASTDFLERRYGPDVTLFAARSYDAKRLYHHPELAIAHGEDYQQKRVVRPQARPSVPLHVLTGPGRTAAYAVFYGDEFIEDPIRFQLKSALALVFRPTRLTTLLLVRAPRSYPVDNFESSPLMTVLIAAVDSFVAQPRASSP
jgi:hypothetical protein